MKMRYIAVPVLLLMLAIILGCQLQQQAQPPAAQQTAPAETVPTPEAQPAPEAAPEEEQVPEAETTPAASETTSAPAPEEAEETTEAGQTTVTRKLNKSEYYKVHLAYTPPAPAVREGVVYELLSSTPGRVVGTVRPDGETRRYPFQTALQLRRYDRVRFTINSYGEMQNLQFVSHAVEPARNATVRNVSP